MITPNLAHDIHTGIAQAKTFVWGIGGAARLPVPQNSRIVITDLYINPFIDVALNANSSGDRRRVYEYDFASGKSRNSIVLRHQYQYVNDVVLPGAYQMDSLIHIDCYWVHTEEVRLNVYSLPRSATFVTTYAPLDDASNEPAPPSGYGTLNNGGLSVAKNVALIAGGSQIIPMGSKNTPTIPTGTKYTQELHAEIIGGAGSGIIADPTVIANTNGYPIVNIFYVLYENVLSPNVKGS